MNKYRKALKNYTTAVATEKIIADIQQIILDFGGTGIMFDYDSEQRIKAMLFKIEVEGNTQVVNIPFNAEKTRGVLDSQGVLKSEDYFYSNNQKDKAKQWNKEHAYRVTLANVRDWLDAQLAILTTQMFEFPQIFLPYMQGRDGKTLYETVKENNFLLPEPK